MSGTVAVQACGMTTTIGLDAPAASAALRARLANFQETRFIVSATGRPYAARLDGCAYRQGMRSSMRNLGWPSRMARRVAAR
jgi:hypothetical protein